MSPGSVTEAVPLLAQFHNPRLIESPAITLAWTGDRSLYGVQLRRTSIEGPVQLNENRRGSDFDRFCSVECSWERLDIEGCTN